MDDCGCLVGGYTYTLTGERTHSGSEDESLLFDIPLSVTDSGQTTTNDTLTVRVEDDRPQAAADTSKITEDALTNQVAGNVLTGESTGDQADTQGADGAQVSGVQAGSVAPGDHVADGNLSTAITGQYGRLVLQPDGSYSYQLDNSNPAVNALKDGDTLEDVFSYTITDNDGDPSTTTLTITINGHTDGEPAVTIADNNGAEEGDHSLAEDATNPMSGTFSVSAPDGLKGVTVNGETLSVSDLEALNTTPRSITGSEGTLTLTGYDASTGEIRYEYQQSGSAKDHSAGDDSVIDSFVITVTDNADVESDPESLDILITDTAPVANADTGTVDEDGSALVGNVLTTTNASAGDVADTLGADSVTVTGVVVGHNTAEHTGNVGTGLPGNYGTLTLNDDGTYSYSVDADNATVNALKDGDSLTEVFSYTIQDADGDWNTTTLTITVEGNTDGAPVITPVDSTTGVDGEITVYESGLSNGSDASSDGESANGTMTITAADGLDGITIGGQSFSVADLQALSANPSAPILVEGGELVLTGFTATNSVGGVPTAGELSYTYTLTGERTHSGSEDESLLLEIPLSVIDAGNATSNGTLKVQVEDDVPTATADTGGVTEGATLAVDAASGVLSNDTAGADGWSNTGAVVGVVAGDTGTTSSSGVGGRIDGQYGYLTLNADGSYTYVSTADTISADAQDVFTYTVRDGDGDETSTTLTINVADVSIVEAPVTETVTESGLAGGSEEGNNGHTTTGQVILPSGVSAVPATYVSTDYGTFTIDKDGNYSYTLTDSTAGDNVTDSFTYTSQDGDGNTVTNTVTITIVDDVPVAVADENSITEDATPNPVTGNVLTGESADDQSDTQGADGAQVSGVQAGSVAPGDHVADGNLSTAITGQYGSLVLQPDGSYSYQLDNSNTEVNALKDGDTLEDVFSYTITDNDGDQSTTTLTITINGHTDGEPAVTIADNNGAEVGDHSIAEDATNPVSGTFSISAPDGLKGVTVNGETLSVSDLEALNTTPRSITGSEGTLTLTGYDASTGEIHYEYQQSGSAKDHSAGDDSVIDSFVITMTDNADVESDPESLDILITDTAPVANADANTIAEDTIEVTGNVIGGTGVSTGDVADTEGADGATVTGITSSNVAGNTATENAGTLVIEGEYGTLTINPDGNYRYEINNSNLYIQGLSESEILTESFTYTLTDQDGDTSDATLTLTGIGIDDAVTVAVPDDRAATMPDGNVGDQVVFESGLADGSAPNTTNTVVQSSFTIQSLDGLATSEALTFTYTNANGDSRTLSLSKAQVETLGSAAQVVDTHYGELALNGYSQAADGTLTIDYEYTLERAPTVNAEDVTDSIQIQANDRDGDSDSATLGIKIVDDAPVADDDSANVTEGRTLEVEGVNGVLANDKAGADGWSPGGAVIGVAAGTVVGEVSGNVATAITGTYGTLTLNADGSYTYVANPDSTDSDVEDVFTYTVVDSDGDRSTATITINVADVTEPPTNTDGSVSEAGLPTGTEASTDSELISNASLDLQDGWSVVTAQSGSTAFGNWSVATDGTFNYTLTERADHSGSAPTRSEERRVG